MLMDFQVPARDWEKKVALKTAFVSFVMTATKRRFGEAITKLCSETLQIVTDYNRCSKSGFKC